MIDIEHTKGCQCFVADDGAVYVRAPCFVLVQRGVVTKHRIQQLAHKLRKSKAVSAFVARCPGYVELGDQLVRCGYPRRFEVAGTQVCQCCRLRYRAYITADGVVHADDDWP